MPQIITGVAEFVADRPWGARDIAMIEGASVRLHWTNAPYVWHVNDGPEVFVVLDGEVEMKWRSDGQERTALLQSKDIFFAQVGDEHVAHPRGEARILVIEKHGSI